jgi:hypothetical protein
MKNQFKFAFVNLKESVFTTTLHLNGLTVLLAAFMLIVIYVWSKNQWIAGCQFVLWIAVAFIIAKSVTYYAMNKWLENFAYKTELSWWIFVLAGLLALGIALLTVLFQSWKVATRNPVEALRYE